MISKIVMQRDMYLVYTLNLTNLINQTAFLSSIINEKWKFRHRLCLDYRELFKIALTNESNRQSQDYCPENESCVPNMAISDQRQAKEHEDNAITGSTGRRKHQIGDEIIFMWSFISWARETNLIQDSAFNLNVMQHCSDKLIRLGSFLFGLGPDGILFQFYI